MYHEGFHGCATKDSGLSGFGSSFLVAGLKYCSNAMCGRCGCLLDLKALKNATILLFAGLIFADAYRPQNRENYPPPPTNNTHLKFKFYKAEN